tara:strand:- start:21308 stop:22072 length:765 start_codon:yes stop_codon:yes gene_type:complete
MNTYSLIWSFRNRRDCILKSIRSAHLSCPENIPFILVDANSNKYTVESINKLASGLDRDIKVCGSFKRTSLVQAWNLGVMLSDSSHCIFASSDVVFKKTGWFDILKHETGMGEDYVLLENHSVFCISKRLVSAIGWFDEGFGNGPHFDVDYMVRSSEANIPVKGTSSMGTYSHADLEESKIRGLNDMEDRLPMNKLDNEKYFKSKWKSDWTGWEGYLGQRDLPHPPTHISQVERQKEEINWHPSYSKEITEKYS